MTDKKSVTLQEINQVIEYTIWDLFIAKDLYFIFFRIIKRLLRDKSIKKSYSEILVRLKQSLDIAYIVTLYKLFDKRGLGLIKVINHVRSLKESDKGSVNIKKYNEFISKTDEYIKIVEILEQKLNLLRNRYHAHNFPERRGDEIPLHETRKMLSFVENIYDEIGLACFNIPNFAASQENTKLHFQAKELLKFIKVK